MSTRTWIPATSTPEGLRRRNRQVAMVLALVLGGLYALAIWGVLVLN